MPRHYHVTYETPTGLTIPRDKIPDFGCWDGRVTDRGWEFSTVGGTHRDASTIDESNHRVLLRMLAEVDPDEEHHGVLHAGHWAVGWYDHVIVDTRCEAVMRVLADAKRAMDDYPLLSDDDHSALEMERHDEGTCDEGCTLCEYEREVHRDGECRGDCKLCAEDHRCGKCGDDCRLCGAEESEDDDAE